MLDGGAPLLTHSSFAVLQIGADIICDTNGIAQVLEKVYPEPTLFPKSATGQSNESLAFLLSTVMDKLFFGHTVPQIDWTSLPKEFLMDRAELRGGSRDAEPAPLDPTVMMAASKNSQQQLHHYLTMIEHQLASSPTGWFLGTDLPHFADLQLFSPVQFIFGLRKSPGSGVAKGFDESVFPKIWEWHARLQKVANEAKHPEGNVPITPEDAMKIAEATSKAGKFLPAKIDPKAGIIGVPADKLGVNSEDNVNVRLPNVAEGKATGTEFNAMGGLYSLMRDTGKGFDVQIHFPGIGFYYSAL